ncbi:hypothetical protein KIPB_010802 [Kipferlia bialata]|uniref:Uncharacterized protein n=1 Tax=Kipferlia bialata TaxID=797122 RepID=A0A391NPT5_9EUKA|nr:hypothetical protein KIPB_010802 [Kipferlia bialata]|eukprot:g10802.t1
MWILDTTTGKVKRLTLPNSIATLLNDKSLHFTGLTACGSDSVVAFSRTRALRLGLHPGAKCRREKVIVSNIHLDMSVVRPTAEVDIGPYICLFRMELRRHTTQGWEYNVYMYDRVSGEAAMCVSLPYPKSVVCACMLNPTTMLVLLEGGQMLVVELDPCLFQRFSDAY